MLACLKRLQIDYGNVALGTSPTMAALGATSAHILQSQQKRTCVSTTQLLDLDFQNYMHHINKNKNKSIKLLGNAPRTRGLACPPNKTHSSPMFTTIARMLVRTYESTDE